MTLSPLQGRGLVIAAVALCSACVLSSQKRSSTDDETLLKGEVVAGNIETAITAHLTSDPDFQIVKQLPEDPHPKLPKMLLKQDGGIVLDWTAGQQAASLMEDIRQGLHALQAAHSPRGLDIVAFAGGREYWPKLRDIFCREYPGVRYYDLDGFEQFCPAK